MCEHYGDSTFSSLTGGVITSIGNCDFDDIKAYKKVLNHVFAVSQSLINSYIDIMFLKLDTKLIR